MEHAACIAILATTRLATTRLLDSSWNATRDHSTSTRWFVEHAIVNYLLAALTTPHLASSVARPHVALDVAHHGDTRFALCLSVWLHAYHVAFFGLTFHDAVHHAVFVTALAVPGFLWQWGGLGPTQCFFICGLPGASIYTLLAARRMGHCAHVDEPQFSYMINMYLRMPGILMCTLIFLYVACNGHVLPDAPVWACVLQLTLSPINAVYYTAQSRERMLRKRQDTDRAAA